MYSEEKVFWGNRAKICDGMFASLLVNKELGFHSTQ